MTSFTPDNTPNTKIVTRFAPSPTGFMHVGGVRTALFAWALARKYGGTFILRIEDTDKEREVEGSIQHIIDSLQWIGITWDEGVDIGGPHAPYKQSERLESYRKYAQVLIDKGHAYADPYSSEELAAYRKKAEEEKRPFLYRDHRPENPPTWDGTQALRFKTPIIKSYEWNDLVRGDLKAGAEALDDFILIKSDGYPTYNFAHIIDDLEMGVTHIFRADEFISSTPKYLSLYEALGIERPLFATVPPVMPADGTKKLGKRDGAKDILGYKKEGYLPEAMMNFLAFIGWNPGGEKEIFSPEEFIDAFDIKGIQAAGGKLNEDKLDWINKEHLKLLDDDAFAKMALPFVPEKYTSLPHFSALFARLIPTLRERITHFGELLTMEEADELSMFFITPTYDAAMLLCDEKQRKGKDISLKGLSPILEHVRSIVSGIEAESNNTSIPIDGIDAGHIKEALWPYAEEQGRGIVLHAFRVVLSGKERSPDPFSLSAILGKEEVLRRIDNALRNLNEIAA